MIWLFLIIIAGLLIWLRAVLDELHLQDIIITSQANQIEVLRGQGRVFKADQIASVEPLQWPVRTVSDEDHRHTGVSSHRRGRDRGQCRVIQLPSALQKVSPAHNGHQEHSRGREVDEGV